LFTLEFKIPAKLDEEKPWAFQISL
jgi:hypothetical protein